MAAYPAPVVESGTTSGFQATDATSHSVALPATVNAGDLLIAVFGVDGNPTITWDNATVGPWQSESNTTLPSSVGRGAVRSRLCDGTEGGATLTITTSAAEQSAYVVHRISGAIGDCLVATASGNTTANPPLVTAPWTGENNLFLEYGVLDNGTRNITAASASYTGLVVARTNTADGVVVGAATRTLTADSDNPGAFTTSSGAYLAGTVVIRPGVQADGLTTPTVASQSTYTGSSAITHNITIPAVTAGQLLLLEISVNVGITTPPASPWVGLYPGLNGNLRGRTYSLKCDGTEGGTTVSIVLASASLMAGRFKVIDGATGEIEAVWAAAQAPGALDPSWGQADTLWLNIHHNNNASTYTEPRTYTLSGAMHDVSGRGLTDAVRKDVIDNESPYDWTVLSGSQIPITALLAIRPSGVVPLPPGGGVSARPWAARQALRGDDQARFFRSPMPRRFAPIYAALPPASADDGFLTIFW